MSGYASSLGVHESRRDRAASAASPRGSQSSHGSTISKSTDSSSSTSNKATSKPVGGSSASSTSNKPDSSSSTSSKSTDKPAGYVSTTNNQNKTASTGSDSSSSTSGESNSPVDKTANLPTVRTRDDGRSRRLDKCGLIPLHQASTRLGCASPGTGGTEAQAQEGRLVRLASANDCPSYHSTRRRPARRRGRARRQRGGPGMVKSL